MMMEPAVGSSPAVGPPKTHNLIDSRNYVLHYGLKEKRLRKMQSEAYLKTQQKIVMRGDSARAMVLSANLLGMSVMTSQLSMYRWKVSEAQSMTQATSRLQEEVMEALKKGYQVRKTNIRAPKGKSKYADKRALERLFALKMEQIQRRKERREKQKEAAAAAGEDLAMAMADVVDSDSVSLSDVSSDESSVPSGNSSLCSVERLRQGEDHVADGRRRNLPPSDMVSSVVIVDSFTHEPYEDIIEHLRYIDKQYDLNLVIILLLPKNDDARELQGAGQVITPDHQFAMEDAYSRGYDLVLTHYFDHVVVEFLTDTFVSSSGRWRNDVRAKAAVGNYISLKNILMGRIDMNVLKQLAWDDEVDDAGLLDVIGQHSLALHGENKRIGLAGQTLSEGHVLLGPTSPDDESGDFNGTATLEGMALPTTLSRYRTRQMNVHGVTVKKDVFTALDDLASPHRGKDMLGTMMAPAGGPAQHTVRRRRKNADPEDESEDAYEYVLVTIEEQNKNIVHHAFENEMTRLIAESDKKTKTINMLTHDVERLTRTVAALKKSSGMGEEGKFMEADSDPFTGSLMNLSKEQQIYILKERLDMANEQIASMMEDGNQRRSRSNTSRDVGNASWTSQDRGFGGSGRVNKKLVARNRRLYRGYNERREKDIMLMHDYDAADLAERRAGGGGGGGSSRPESNVTRQQKGRKEAGTVETEEDRRRRREQTDTVVSKLQTSLREGSLDPAEASSTIQSALNLIKTQQQRVSQLEELMKSNAALLESTKADLKASQKGAVGGGSKKGKKGGGGDGMSTNSISSRGKSGDSAKGPVRETEPTPADAGARRRRSLSKGKGNRQADAGLDEEAITAAIREVVENESQIAMQKEIRALERKHRFQLKKRGAVIKKILQRLYLNVRKPYTEEYLSELQRQKQQEASHVRGVKQRLTHFLNSLRPEHLVSEEEQQKEGSQLKGVISKLADPEAVYEFKTLGREHAVHSLRLKQLEAEIKDVHSKIKTQEENSEFLEALNYWEQNKAHTQKVGNTNPDTEAYLQSLENELEAEEAVMRWGVPSVVELIEKGVERKDAFQGTLTFTFQSLHSPKFKKESGKWALASAGADCSGTPEMEDDDVETFSEMMSALFLKEDPILADMHKVFVTATHPEMVEVLAVEEDLPPDSKKKTTRGKNEEAKLNGERQGDSEEETEESEEDGEPRSRSSKARAGPGRKGSKHSHAAEESIFLTETGMEVPQSGRPPLAPPPASVRDAITKLSMSSSMPSQKLGEFGIDKVLSSRVGSSQSKSSMSSFSPFCGHPGVVQQLIQSDAGKTKIELYNSALNSYRNGYVHPDRMLDVERSAQSPESVGQHLSEQYVAHHQELLRLLQLLALRTPALGAVLEQHTEDLEKRVTEDLRRASSVSVMNGEANHHSSGGVTVPFLMAYDTAAVTWYVDYLCRTMPEHKTALATSSGRTATEDLRPNRSLRNMKPNDERLQMYEDVVTVLTQPFGLSALGDQVWASPVDRGTHSSVSAKNQSESEDNGAEMRSGSGSHLMDVRKILSSPRALSGSQHGGPVAALRSKSSLGRHPSLWTVDGYSEHHGEHATTDMSHVPEDVAALFSRHDGTQRSGLTAAELYLETELDNEDDADDENIQLMRDIKLRLAYMAQVKEECLAELRLRYKYRQKQIQMREKSKYSGWDKDQDEAPPPREVPDFEVKGGSAAWYGMEAAKRVKDILKRRQRQDQIILGSGGVGVELSKRTAFPRPAQKELDVMQSVEERMRAAHRVLPPLRRRGLSRWQQQMYKGLPQPDDLGYIDPREEAIVNAFGRMARINHRQDGVSFLSEMMDEERVPPGLSERVIAFRQSLQYMQGGQNQDYSGRLDSPFFEAIATAPIPSSMLDPSGISQAVRQRTLARLDLTSWVYGVPTEELQAALEKPVPSLENSHKDDSKVGVVFLPGGGRLRRPSMSMPQGRNVRPGMSMVDGSRAGGRRILPNQNSIYNPYRALGAEQYVTPSALAAQRLSLMLRSSAADSAITGRPPFYPVARASITAEKVCGANINSNVLEQSIPLLGRSSVQQGPVDIVQGKPVTFSTRQVAATTSHSGASLHASGTLPPGAKSPLSHVMPLPSHTPSDVPNPPGGASFRHRATVSPRSSIDNTPFSPGELPAPGNGFESTLAPESTRESLGKSAGASTSDSNNTNKHTSPLQ